MNHPHFHPEAQLTGQPSLPGVRDAIAVEPEVEQWTTAPHHSGIGARLLHWMMLARPHEVRLQFHRYLSRILWVARDGLGRFRHQVIIILILNFLGVSTAALSLGGIMLYAKHAESGHTVPIKLAWMRFHVHRDPLSLMLYGGIVAMFGIFSGVCLYMTERQIQRVTRGYELHCAQRVLSIIGDPLYRGWQDLTLGSSWQGVKLLLNTRARWTAFAFQDMLRAILPILTFGFTLAFLLYIDVWLTLLLVPAAIIYLIPLYHINRGVSKNQNDYRQAAPTVQGAVARGLKNMLDSSGRQDRKVQWCRQALDTPEYERMHNSYYSRLLSDKRVVLLNTIFFVTCLFALFVFFGVATKSYGRSWTELVSYLVALKLAIGALRHVSGLFLKFSRYFPEYREYSHFVQGCQRVREQRRAQPVTIVDAASAPTSLTIRPGSRTMWNSVTRLSWNQGSILWLALASRPGHFRLESAAARLEARLAEPAALAATAYLQADAKLDDNETLLTNALGLDPAPEKIQQLRALLRELEVLDEVTALPDGLSSLAGKLDKVNLSGEVRFAIAAASCMLDRPGVIILAAHILLDLSPPFAERVLRSLSPARIVIAEWRLPRILQPAPATLGLPVAGIVVMDDRRIIGAGDGSWFKFNFDSISEYLGLHKVPSQDYTDIDTDDNDDDGDDEDMDF